MNARFWLLPAASLLATSALAEHSRILADGNRLGSLPVEARFLLPEGGMLSYQHLIEACRDLQARGVVYFRPDTGHCQSVTQVPFSDLPDEPLPAEGIVVFNRMTRETCLPGHCQVVAGVAGGGTGTGVPNAVVESFSAVPESVVGSGTTTLSWVSSEADSCTLDDDQGSASVGVPTTGSLDREVGVTTEFTLTCINAASSDAASLTVTVTEAYADPVFADRFEHHES